MGAYERAHPKTAEKLYSMMGVSYDGTDEGRVEMMAKVPMVAFRPKDAGTGGAAFLWRSANVHRWLWPGLIFR